MDRMPRHEPPMTSNKTRLHYVTYVLTLEGRLDDIIFVLGFFLVFFFLREGAQSRNHIGLIIVRHYIALIALLLLFRVVPTALKQRLKDHGVGGEHVGGEEGELVCLVMIVRVLRVLHRILDQFLECLPLADELDELGDAAAAAKHNQLFFLEQELLNRAALLLVQELIDLHVASILWK